MAVVSSCREMLGKVPQRAQPLSLVATQGHSKETASDKLEEGGDDVKSSWPLRVGLHTSYNGLYRGMPTCEGESIPKNRGSACRGEYVPGSCTHRPSYHGSEFYQKPLA